MSDASLFHDPRKIKDPTMMHHTKRRPYVYFVEMSDDVIKIGHVGSLKHGLTRWRQYELGGAKSLLAVIPGREIEEKELHRVFADDLVRGNEYFAATERILLYIEALLEGGFAAPTYEQAEYVGTVDFSVWRPGAPALNHSVELDGQINLFSRLPTRERIAVLSRKFNRLSMTDDWFTPRKWADLARTVMGGIDLGPASCKQANDQSIGAEHWYTKELNGVDRRNIWFGRVWINPPYGKIGDGTAKAFMERLYREVNAGAVEQAITCLNLNSMSTQWFREFLAPVATAHCIADGRIEFEPPAGVTRAMGSPVNGTVFTYVGPNLERFEDAYSAHGQVLFPQRKIVRPVALEAAE